MALGVGTVDAVIVVVYLAVVITLGLIMKRRAQRNIGSYFLGERRLPWWALAMSGSSSYFDITGTMWIVSLFVTMGVKGMWVQWIWGFPITVFYMAYMGPWIRRSGVMTGSEWMRTRFGTGRGGELARLSYTVFAVLTITAFLAYGSVGMGKFGSVYLPFGEHTCAALIIGVTGLYVIVGGFHGVVLVEIFQTVVLSLGALLIAYIGFTHVSWDQIAAATPREWSSMAPAMRFDYLHGTEYYVFGFLLIVWVVKGLLLDLSGPEQLYDFQRFLAARSPREASKLGALWGVVHTIRWPMAMAIAVMGIAGVVVTENMTDAEKVLPVVIDQMLPVGLRGLAIAALLSGFLATFNSTVNGGASYIVKDIYQKYIKPDASDRRLIVASYISSAALIVVGIVIGFGASSINQMFTWIMGTLGAGVLLPNVLRWYWWRLNGAGYAAGTFTGMVLSLVQAIVPQLNAQPLYVTFPIIALAVLFVCVIVTLRTPATDRKVLMEFYRTVQPWGFWTPVAKQVKKHDRKFKRRSRPEGDLLNVVLGLPCLLAMYTFPIYLILHWYAVAGALFAVTLGLGVALYFTWYKRLDRFEHEVAA